MPPALAKKRAKKPAKNPVVEVAPATESQPVVATSEPIDAEMAAMRALQIKSRASYADLCRIILLQTGEFSKFKTDAERCSHVQKKEYVDLSGVSDIYTDPVTISVAATAALEVHNLEKSLMYAITGMRWYALQNAEALGLVPEGASVGDQLSGNDLIVLMDEALEEANLVRSWNDDENPYKEFGYDTYDAMYNNPAGPGVQNSSQGSK